MAEAKAIPLQNDDPPADGPSQPTTLGRVLGARRKARDIRPAEMARQLGVSQPMVNNFESGSDTSAPMILDYLDVLDVSQEEVEAHTRTITNELMELIYDRSMNYLERAIVVDKLQRAAHDRQMAKARMKARGEVATPTGLEPAFFCVECGHEAHLTVTTGRQAGPPASDQLSFFPLRRHG